MHEAIITIARVFKWNPFVIGKLYLDDIDSEGLYYWFEEAQRYIKDTNAALNG